MFLELNLVMSDEIIDLFSFILGPPLNRGFDWWTFFHYICQNCYSSQKLWFLCFIFSSLGLTHRPTLGAIWLGSYGFFSFKLLNRAGIVVADDIRMGVAWTNSYIIVRWVSGLSVSMHCRYYLNNCWFYLVFIFGCDFEVLVHTIFLGNGRILVGEHLTSVS